MKTKKSDGPLRCMTIKISRQDKKNIRKMAKKFASGNLSLWLRQAGLRYVPDKKERAALKAAN